MTDADQIVPRTQTHEFRGDLLFADHGASPYWALRRVYQEIGGGATGVDVEIDGEEWSVSLGYQESGLEPTREDQVDQLYEYRVNATGDGERKIPLLIQPRLDWSDDRRPGSVPSNLGEATNVRVETAVNVDLEELRDLVPRLLDAVACALDLDWSSRYFTGDVHRYSSIHQLEEYVRLDRDQARKLVRSGGIFRRLWELVADLEGSKVVFSSDNTEIVGYNHQLRFDSGAADRVFQDAPGRRRGFQLKHYHPKHVREEAADDPLYHPKIGILFKKGLNDSSVPWSDRRDLREELVENLFNILNWGNVPVRPGSWYVSDRHYSPLDVDGDRDVDALDQEVRADGGRRPSVEWFGDPTPEIESRQESILIRTFSRLTESDRDVLEEMVATDGGVGVSELEGSTEWSESTIYRALERLDGLLDREAGNVRWVSRKIADEISEIVSVASSAVDSAARAAEEILSLDPRRLEEDGSAWQAWVARYGGEFVEVDAPTKRDKIRLDTLMSLRKSDDLPFAPEVLDYGRISWSKAGRDVAEFLDALAEISTPDGTEVVPVRRLLRRLESGATG